MPNSVCGSPSNWSGCSPKKEDPSVIQSWLTGLNLELGDRVPLRLMRENDLETVAPEIMGAARAFLVGG